MKAQFHVGQQFTHNGEMLEVTSATPIITPYKRVGQTTKITGWSLGVRGVGKEQTSKEG